MSMFILFDTSPTTPFSEMVVFIIMFLVYPSKCDGYAHLSCVCRPLDTLFAPHSGMVVSIMPLSYLKPLVDAMHTYSQVCEPLVAVIHTYSRVC
mgnify:CR=1 FL=1